MSDDNRNPIEQALDLIVYAPVGVAAIAKDTAPTVLHMFVTRGHSELERRRKELLQQASQYKVIGRFAVKYGGPVVKREAEQRLGDVRRLAEETIGGIVGTGTGTNGNGASSSTASAPPVTPRSVPRSRAPKGPEHEDRAPPVAEPEPEPSAPPVRPPSADLAIPDYDELSASQVVERLEGLTPDELRAVRTYERAHRGRNTILGKISQLST